MAEQLAVVVDLDSRRRVPAVAEVRLTKRELAARWGVSERSVERWMRERGLPFEKPFEGGMVRFVPSEVEAWWRGRSA
jgi:excisionase family DNA binding protein